MRRLVLAATVVAAALLCWNPPAARAQAKEPYRPLSNGEMAQQGIWDAWIVEFTNLTAPQKAEVVRRHIQMCLDSFEMTDEQRAVVKDMTAKYVTEAAFVETDPEKRRAFQQAVQPDSEKAMALLGPQLGMRVFAAKPPIAVLLAVKNDPAFKQGSSSPAKCQAASATSRRVRVCDGRCWSWTLFPAGRGPLFSPTELAWRRDTMRPSQRWPSQQRDANGIELAAPLLPRTAQADQPGAEQEH